MRLVTRNLASGAPSYSRTSERRRLDDLLEVVQDDQHALPLERARDALFKTRFAVVADAERMRDGRQQHSGLQHRLQRHEVGAVGKQSSFASATSIASRLLPIPPGRSGSRPGPSPGEDLAQEREVLFAADRAGVGDGQSRSDGAPILGRHGPRTVAGLIEALREQAREIAGDPLPEFVGIVERR